MEIKINGKSENISGDNKLSEILKSKNLHKDGVVVLLNDSVIKRENWADFELKENDSIELLSFVSGG